MLNPVIARLEADPALLQAHWCLPLEEARFLYLLACMGRFRNMLEVGTSIGYSTLHLAQAALENDGFVTAIDASAQRLQMAGSHLAEAGLAERVTLRHGDALTVLQAEQAGHFDFIFLDARKSEYRQYWREAERLLMPGGVLVADNTVSHRERMTDFLQDIRQSAYWRVSELPTPNGLLLGRYIGPVSPLVDVSDS